MALFGICGKVSCAEEIGHLLSPDWASGVSFNLEIF